MTKRDEKCSERVQAAFESRMADVRAIMNSEDPYEEGDPSLGNIYDYGLSIDYVTAGTFRDQRAGYARYQLSWGGPSEEFRIFDNGEVEFWLLDWFDGAPVKVTGNDAHLIQTICEHIKPEHVDWTQRE